MLHLRTVAMLSPWWELELELVVGCPPEDDDRWGICECDRSQPEGNWMEETGNGEMVLNLGVLE